MASPVQTLPSVLDVERVREEFPILHRTVRGKPLVYLDSAATTQKPRHVLDALARYYAHGNANIHRGVYLLSEEATAARPMDSSSPALAGVTPPMGKTGTPAASEATQAVSAPRGLL